MTRKLEKNFNAIRNARRKIALSNLERTEAALESSKETMVMKDSGLRIPKDKELSRVRREMKILRSRIK